MLVGQIAEEEYRREQAVLPVLVQSGRRTLARALTNRLGEFELELDRAANLRLIVGVPGPQEIVVKLPLGHEAGDGEEAVAQDAGKDRGRGRRQAL